MAKDPRLVKIGAKDYNQPVRTTSHPTKSHAVVARYKNKRTGKIETELIRFGQQGVRGAGSNPKSEEQKQRRESFRARHAENIAKGPSSAAFWSSKIKW
jgi:hypothetical protein